jgi:subtilisin family serine protease
VVTAAGNLGKNANGQTQYGAITAPGNAPWVLTVGAYSHEGTIYRNDDVIAGYSSRGPTAIDFQAKPDLVAPGTGIVSLSSPTSTMYYSKPQYLLSGILPGAARPYLSLTGTSMAAPVVSGAVALMLQANPSLTPNLVKAILQYTAQTYPSYNALTQGAGFINAHGAVQLARFFKTAQNGSQLSIPREWSKHVFWGNHRISGGVIKPNANAFQAGTSWGAAFDGDGDNIVWGTLLNGDNLVWGTVDFLSADNLVWGTVRNAAGDNLVWGTHGAGDNLVWGTTLGHDNLVWGTDCGGKDCDNLVWGTAVTASNLVWGTSFSADNLVWGTADQFGADNLVWGTNGETDNLVWGTSAEYDNMTWGNSGEDAPLFDDPIAEPVNFDQTVFESLFTVPPVTAPASEQNTLTQPVDSTLGVVGISGGL